MPRDAAETLDWRETGVVTCPGCRARYAVREARIAERGDRFFRCEACDAVVDEWCSATAKSFTRVS